MDSSNEVRREVIVFDSVDYSHPNGNIALRKVNFRINRGELIAILGGNGAGKTTLIRHMNGLLKPTHGTVTVFGKDAKTASCAELSKRVGIVFQNPSNQLFEQSVRKEIEFALKNFGLSKSTVDERTNWALETFALGQYSERAPMELSGGEKKRLCIALVLAWDPDVLILDEPTVGQDSEQKEKLAQMLLRLVSLGKTVILVTHDVEFVWPLQPRVIVLANGIIFADGSSQEILSNDSILHSGSILPPQLVALQQLMGLNPPAPADPYKAKIVLENLQGKKE